MPNTWHQAFEATARRVPDAIALVASDRCLTYGELNRRANRLARVLRTRCHAGPESLVGVIADHTIEGVIGVIGILKTGAGYVPLDPRYPTDRLQYMIRASGISVIAADERHAVMLDGVEEIDVQSVLAEGHALDASDLDGPGHGDNVALVIFTSGSTGKPKGVTLTHRALLSRAANGAGYAVGEVSSHKASLSVVAHVSDLLMPLQSGATVAIVADDRGRDVDRLAETIWRHGITRLMAVPSQLSAILDGGAPVLTWLRHVATIVVSGEQMPPNLVAVLNAWFPEATLVNAYGLSETGGAVAFGAGARDCVSIGRSVPGVDVYVLDDRLHEAARGVTGDVYVAGGQLGRGYLGPAHLTAERFVANPFSSTGARLYRTGDRARRGIDGTLEWAGRSDHEVKIRGFRVNLADIELLLEQHDAIERAVVVAEGAPGAQRLVAYITARGASSRVDVGAIREYLAKACPPHMIPASFRVLDDMPLLPNGKVDRQQLADRPDERSYASPQDQSVPQSTVEQLVAAIWAEVLEVKQVGLKDHFFDLGGDSLLAMRVASRLARRCAVDVRAHELFEHPTLEEFSRLIDQRVH